MRAIAPPHGPALGFTHRLLGRFHVTGVFWCRFHYWAATTLPSWLRRPVIAAFTAGFFISMHRIRTAIADNLDAVLGPVGRIERWRRSFRTMHEFAYSLTDRYSQMAAIGDAMFEVEGEIAWRAAIANGRGAVLATAHIGPWETAAYLGADSAERIVHVVREEEIDPRAQAFISSLIRTGGPQCVTHFAGEDSRLVMELAEALRRGELVALQCDRPRARGRSVQAQLFGRPMTLPIGPAAMARAADVPLVPVFSFRDGTGHGRTVIRPPFLVPRTSDREADIAVAVHQLSREIEWAIRERPNQWFCFRKLW